MIRVTLIKMNFFGRIVLISSKSVKINQKPQVLVDHFLADRFRGLQKLFKW